MFYKVFISSYYKLNVFNELETFKTERLIITTSEITEQR